MQTVNKSVNVCFIFSTQEQEDILTFSSSKVLFTIFSLCLAAQTTAQTVIKAEPLHPTANLSYKVAGKRYTPQKNIGEFTQIGQASWYGKAFHGRKTAGGERFDMNKLTAAHPTLPIPSYARVTNLKNGKSVVVRINDRGPFHSKRIIDVSQAAAKALGFLSQGVANVKVERLVPQNGVIKTAAPEIVQPSEEAL